MIQVMLTTSESIKNENQHEHRLVQCGSGRLDENDSGRRRTRQLSSNARDETVQRTDVGSPALGTHRDHRRDVGSLTLEQPGVTPHLGGQPCK
jgi:hypothetical protein